VTVVNCARQVLDNVSTQTVQALGSATSTATTAAVVGSAIIQIASAGAMAQVWGMINGLQLMVHFPALNFNFPSNAIMVVKSLLKVATFDIPNCDVQTLTGGILATPAEDTILEDIKDNANLLVALG